MLHGTRIAGDVAQIPSAGN